MSDQCWTIWTCEECGHWSAEPDDYCYCYEGPLTPFVVVPVGVVPTREQIQAVAEAIYLLTGGARIPGVLHGVQCGHVGTTALAEVVLRAALGVGAPAPTEQPEEDQ